MEKKFKNILLIAGTGQNVGKTLFASRVIENNASKFPIISIKISPHLHPLNSDAQLIESTDGYTISKEINTAGNKDSQRFLIAGSKEVYYVQCMDEQLTLVFEKLSQLIRTDSPIVCESGGLRQVLKPGLFLMINKKNNKLIKDQALRNKELADRWIEFNDQEFDLNPSKVKFSQSGWSIQN
ncbi:hypothetical protein L3073_10795 [Ancylomarina sp. DW003]|nr:hypothetical protein [Ancylomarina sp. DW003]MDE5422695.1 hypothetical protein [Ancylomarina sp. DW003]